MTGVSSRNRAAARGLRVADDRPGDELHRAGLHEPGHDDEQHTDGDQAGVAHAGDRLGDARQD